MSLYIDNGTEFADSDSYDNQTAWSPFYDLSESTPELSAALLSLMFIQTFFIFVANSITIMSIVRIPSLWSNTIMFIGNLSGADLIACILPFCAVTRYNLRPETLSWQGVCYLEKFLLMACLLGNMIFALGVAIDRYIFMAFPLRYDVIVTKRKARYVAGATWIFIILQTIIVVTLTHLVDTTECYFNGLLIWGNFYLVVVIEFSIALLLSLRFVLNYIYMTWKQSRQTSAWLGSVAVAGGENREISNMMSGVVIIHALCYIPSFIVGGLFREKPASLIYQWDFVVSTFILVNSWIKPFIYYKNNKTFKCGYDENLKDITSGKFLPRPMPPLSLTPAPP